MAPVYQVAAPLKGLVRSLQEQSLAAWQCVAVDDGSTDASGAVLDAIAREDARFTTIHQRNGGVSAARNRGLARATGAYVCFVDGDDRLAPDWLATFLRLAHQTKADLVQLRKTEWPEGAPPPVVPPPAAAVGLSDATNDFAARYRARFLFYLKEAWPFLYCIKRSLLTPEVRFPVGVPINEDTLFILGLLPRIRTVAFGDYAGYCYRLRAGSALRSRRQGRAVAAILEGVALLWREVALLPLPLPTQRLLAKHLSAFCWGSFLDWARDAPQAAPEERQNVHVAMKALLRAPFWSGSAVSKKYLFAHLPPFKLFLSTGWVGPMVCFARVVAWGRPLRTWLRTKTSAPHNDTYVSDATGMTRRAAP